jgi:hypothetical protein
MVSRVPCRLHRNPPSSSDSHSLHAPGLPPVRRSPAPGGPIDGTASRMTRSTQRLRYSCCTPICCWVTPVPVADKQRPADCNGRPPRGSLRRLATTRNHANHPPDATACPFLPGWPPRKPPPGYTALPHPGRDQHNTSILTASSWRSSRSATCRRPPHRRRALRPPGVGAPPAERCPPPPATNATPLPCASTATEVTRSIGGEGAPTARRPYPTVLPIRFRALTCVDAAGATRSPRAPSRIVVGARILPARV